MAVVSISTICVSERGRVSILCAEESSGQKANLDGADRQDKQDKTRASDPRSDRKVLWEKEREREMKKKSFTHPRLQQYLLPYQMRKNLSGQSHKNTQIISILEQRTLRFLSLALRFCKHHHSEDIFHKTEIKASLQTLIFISFIRVAPWKWIKTMNTT